MSGLGRNDGVQAEENAVKGVVNEQTQILEDGFADGFEPVGVSDVNDVGALKTLQEENSERLQMMGELEDALWVRDVQNRQDTRDTQEVNPVGDGGEMGLVDAPVADDEKPVRSVVFRQEDDHEQYGAGGKDKAINPIAQSATLTVWDAQNIDPDEYVKVVSQAQQTDLPVEVMLRMSDQLQRRRERSPIDFSKLIYEAPVMTQMCTNSHFARMSHDDLDSLSKIEAAFKIDYDAWGEEETSDSEREVGLGAKVFDNLIVSLLPIMYPISEAKKAGWFDGDEKSYGEIGWNGLIKGLSRMESKFHAFSFSTQKDILDRLLNSDDTEDTISSMFPTPFAPTRLSDEERLKVIENRRQAMRRSLEKLAEVNKRIDEIPMADVEKRLAAANGFDKLMVIADSPLESAFNWGSIFLGEEGIGVAATAVASRLGGPLGAAAVAGLWSYPTNYGKGLLIAFKERGIDPANFQEMDAAVQDKKTWKELNAQAETFARIYSIADAVSAGILIKADIIPVPVILSKWLTSSMVKFGLNLFAKQTVKHGGHYIGNLTSRESLSQKLGAETLGSELANEVLINTIIGSDYNATYDVSALFNAVMQSQLATHNVQAIRQLNQLARDSKLCERSPEEFGRFVEELANRSNVQTVYLDAYDLMSSGFADKLLVDSPAVERQLSDALMIGGQIALPVKEYMARVACSHYADELAKYIRLNAEGISYAEGRIYTQKQQERLERATEEENVVAISNTQVSIDIGESKQVNTFSFFKNASEAEMTAEEFEAYQAMYADVQKRITEQAQSFFSDNNRGQKEGGYASFTLEAFTQIIEEARYSDQILGILLMERNALARKAAQPEVQADGLKVYAQRRISQIPVKEVDPLLYASAYKREVQRAREALDDGNVEQAFVHQNNAVLQAYLAKEANERKE